ncbi:3412_t:CDS:2 [Diversispora eburnea]|uniref:3412_t:CDS:1 n=1 Tax=Diversispora eburnea TaxID=1213867 RepID=A0A9N9G083_9GLOM|nr:3412_t:CDS:2 [Diversispora eburnea]
MAVIKVTYNQISRRFDISSNTTWVTLESQLRSLFKLPTNSSISLSYTDEDGDAITLSSDLELFEVLSSVHDSSSNNSNGSVLKFVLDVHEYNREISRESDNTYFINDIPERKEKNAGFTTHHNREREEYEEYKPLNKNNLHVTITEEAEEPTFEPNIFSNDFVKTLGSSSKSNREENDKQEDKNKDEKSSSQESPYNRRHLFIDSRLPLFVHPLLSNRSRFSPFGHHYQPSYSHTSHPSFSDCEILCPRFSSNPRFNSNNNCCNNSSNNHCIIVLGFKRIVKVILSILLFITLMKLFFAAFCPLLILFLLGKLWTRVSSNNLRPYPESFGFGRCHSISIHCKNEEGEEKEDEEDENELRYFSRRRFGGPPRCHRSQFSEEFKRRECQQQQHEINKKLETLKSMGFNLNDEILKELVKRSNGNLERVVERLLASQ